MSRLTFKDCEQFELTEVDALLIAEDVARANALLLQEEAEHNIRQLTYRRNKLLRQTGDKQ